VALHLLLLRVIVFSGWVPQLVAPATDPVVLAPLPAAGETRARLKLPALPRATARQRLRGSQPLPGGIEAPTSKPAEATEPTAAPAPPTAVVTPDTGGAAGVARRIAPGLAGGKLWVEPLPLPPNELAQRLQRSHVELVDSAVTATIQAFLDSIAADPASKAAALPSWTTTIAGRKFGLDSRNIYVAGLKIPAAVLALLHLPSGNESKAFDRSGWLYDDLRIAAQRSANVADFKRVIREIRERKEQEREFDRNRRTAPPKEEPQ
jgi:hypothetical protein